MTTPDVAFAVKEITDACTDCGATVVRSVPAAGDFTFGAKRAVRCASCETAHEDRERIARETQAREDEEVRHAKQCERALLALAVPPLFEGVSLSTLTPFGSPANQQKLGRAHQIARRIVGELSSKLISIPLVAFTGSFGAGKTATMWAIAAELAGRYGLSARVVGLAPMVRDLRTPWRSKDGADEAARLAAYTDVDFLGIDEVSSHAFYGQNIHQHLYDVLNERLQMRRTTVLTTNEDDEGLTKILGGALMSRLELGGIVDFGTEDYRRLAA